MTLNFRTYFSRKFIFGLIPSSQCLYEKCGIQTCEFAEKQIKICSSNKSRNMKKEVYPALAYMLNYKSQNQTNHHSGFHPIHEGGVRLARLNLMIKYVSCLVDKIEPYNLILDVQSHDNQSQSPPPTKIIHQLNPRWIVS